MTVALRNGLRGGVYSAAADERIFVRAAMQLRNGRRIAAETDPLSALDDNFAGTSLDPKWSIYKPGCILDDTVGGGALRLQPIQGGPGATGAFWYNEFDAMLVWQPVTGDFDAVLDMQATNDAGSGTPPVSQYRIAGVAAHDPDRPTVFDYNYVHVGFGSAAEATNQVESKNTENSVSDFSAAAWPTAEGQVRLVRQGQFYSTYVRALPSDPWQWLLTYDRTTTPMPATLQLGLMVYSNDVAADIVALFRDFSVTTPPPSPIPAP